MATAEDVERLLTDRANRCKLYGLALRNLPFESRDSAADVVSEAVMWTWLQRDHVDNALAYAVHVCKTVAKTWQVRHPDDRCDQLSALYDAVTIGSRDFPSSTDSVREMRCPDLNPEQALIEREEEAGRIPRRERIVAQLSPAWRRNYREWEARGYHCTTHAETVKSTRIRKKIAEIAGGKSTGLHVTHLGWTKNAGL